MKYQSITFIVLILIFITCIISCSIKEPNINQKAEISEIAKVVDSSIGWVKNKDLDLLYSIIANDSNYLSVHPDDQIVRGFEQFKENEPFWMSPNFQYVRHEISDLTINLSQSGTVAWFYCKLNDINTWKGQPATWENTRWTGVLEKRNGKWELVQQHFSFAK